MCRFVVVPDFIMVLLFMLYVLLLYVTLINPLLLICNV